MTEESPAYEPPPTRYLTTKASIASLWALAEIDGEVEIRLPSEYACRAVRNRLYAHRAQIRKRSAALTGLEASHLDGFTFQFEQEFRWDEDAFNDIPTGKYVFTITYNPQIEFELLSHHEPVTLEQASFDCLERSSEKTFDTDL